VCHLTRKSLTLYPIELGGHYSSSQTNVYSIFWPTSTRVEPVHASSSINYRRKLYPYLPAMSSATRTAIEKAKSTSKQPKLDVEEYLTAALSSTPPELHAFFQSFLELHSRKCVVPIISLPCTDFRCRLWHQLTVKLTEFLDHPLAKQFRVEVFSRFVRDFEDKLNQLRLVEMGVKVSEDISSASRDFRV
jgi:hypothetical protein